MTATLIDGREIAGRIRQEIAERVAQMKAEYGVQPGLATVLVGDSPASHSYVKMKRKACAEVGIESFGHELPEQTSQQELQKIVGDLNARPDAAHLAARAIAEALRGAA